MKDALNLLHLTDLHLFKDPAKCLLGINTARALQEVVKYILYYEQTRPDLIVLTGDIAQDESLEAYTQAQEVLSRLACPIVATMGNHDQSSAFTSVFGSPLQLIDSFANWNLLMLNSHLPQAVHGHLDRQNLILLQETLAKYPEQNLIIFIHHHVLNVGSNWIDKIKLDNPECFLEMIQGCDQVKAVICGHVHQDTQSSLGSGPVFLSTPATSWQFAVRQDNFTIDPLMPGYRWIKLYHDGHFESRVERIPYSPVFIPNQRISGY